MPPFFQCWYLVDIGESADFEYALAYTGIENLTIKAILADYGTNSTGPFDGSPPTGLATNLGNC